MKKQMTEQRAEQKRLFLAILVTVILMYGVNIIFPNQEDKGGQNAPSVLVQADENIAKQAPVATDLENVVSDSEANAVQAQAVKPAIVLQPQTLKNDYVSGLFDVAQGGVVDLDLLKYKETLDKNSPAVKLLSSSYYSTLSWGSQEVSMPFADGLKEAVEAPIEANKAQKYVFENENVRLIRTVMLDDKYMLSITDELQNISGVAINVYQTGSLVRQVKDQTRTTNVHEGFVAYADNKLREEKYDSVQDDPYTISSMGGWFGLTDKYWESIVILDPADKANLRFSADSKDWYTASFKTQDIALDPNASVTRTVRLYAGVKDVAIIDAYQKALDISHFDLSIDFGWYPFLTRPFLYFLNWLYSFIGNMGVAILVFATLIRLALLPIAQKSYESMAKMRKLQPQLKSIQMRFKTDPQRMQMETMNLYKREKVNPASGCLPLFLQVPIFFALYKVLSISVNMRQAPFFGWIQDLSVPDPATILTGFGYFDWPVPAIINIGIWPILMGITMYVQQKLSPAPNDPRQAKVMRFLPVIFTFMLGGFASGLVIYWTWSNILSIAQQKYIMKKVGVK